VKDEEAGQAIKEVWLQLEKKRWKAMKNISLEDLLQRTEPEEETRS
jgi:DNA-binding IscR family transcriptional regulator